MVYTVLVTVKSLRQNFQCWMAFPTHQSFQKQTVTHSQHIAGSITSQNATLMPQRKSADKAAS